jgi:Protein of unknown function (DUF2530)
MKQALPVVILGTCAWAVALVVEIAISAEASSIWICVAGIGLGLLGVAYILRGLFKSRKKF